MCRLQAVRSLGRARAFALSATLTVALAVATGSAIASIIDAVLFRPLPYADSEQLVGLWHEAPGIGIPLLPQSAGTYVLYHEARSFESIGAYVDGESPVSYGETNPVTERLPVAGVTASIFTTLRARPILGRLFTDLDELPGTPKVLLVSEHYWRTRLDATRAVIGSHLRLDGIDREIVGVLPASFGFPGSNIDVWAPIVIDPQGYLGWFGPRAIGRLRPGVSIAAARSELTQILQRAPERFAEQKPGIPLGPMLAKTRVAPVIHPLRQDAIGGFERMLTIGAVTVLLLVLVALSNISSLVLARVEGRQRELAVRSALGASTTRLWWTFLIEIGVIVGVGGGTGLGFAASALALLPRTGATQLVDPRLTDSSRIVLPRLDEIHPDATLVLSAVALTMIFGAAAAALGVGRLTTRQPGRVLREGGRSGTGGWSSQRLRAAFVALEVALSLVLLSGSAMLGHSLHRLLRVDAGFDPSGKVTFWTSLRGTRYFDQHAVERFYRTALDRVAHIPGVDEVGIVSKLPLENGPVLQLMTVEDAQATSAAGGWSPSALASASTGYFHAIGIPLLAGRVFDETNVRRGAAEAVVSRAFAIHYWGDSTGRRALGRRFKPVSYGPWHSIVGVVGDVRDTALTAPPLAVVYVPYALDERHEDVFRVRHDMAFVIRTHRPAAALQSELLREIQSLDPIVPIVDVRTLDEHVASAGRRVRFVLLLLGAGAAVTLALGVVGLYGVIAYVVNLRAREIGIRIALGLTPTRAAQMIVRQGMLINAIGATIGVASFLAFARLLRNLAFGVSAVDALSVGTALLAVLCVTTVATWLSARRAARIDPSDALRAD